MRTLVTLQDCLQCIETELRELGWWATSPPSVQALRSREPFCVDTLSFEQWLQWVLLPRMQALLEAQAPLPSHSAIAEMADEVYAQQLGHTSTLRRAIKQFDRLLSQSQKAPPVH